MRIDFHKWQDYQECPKKFALKHVKKEPYPVPDNDYPKLYGKTIEKFFELYCNIWRFKTPYLFPEVIRERIEKIYEGILEHSTVNWSRGNRTKEEILEQVVADTCAIMDSPNQNYFLNTKSEISINMTIKGGHVINGRIDFLHYPPMSQDFTIIDGKGASKMGRYVNKDQLLFYTLLCFFQYKRLPLEAGFFYYRFNTFAPVHTSPDVMNEFRARLSLDIKKMTEPIEHGATPSAKSCQYCNYLLKCPEGLLAKAQRAKKSKIELEGDGLIEFSF